MKDNQKEKAVKIVADLAGLFGMENVKLTSELAEGEYTLEDGTNFRIDAEGNLVDVVGPDADAAEAVEAARVAEEEVALAAVKKTTDDLAEALEALELSKAKVTELETEVVSLTKTKKIVTAPTVKKLERIEMNAHMTHRERVQARLFNTLNKV